MTIDAWLEKALQDAERRDLPALKPLLEALARSMSALRAADWNDDVAAGTSATRVPPMSAEPRTIAELARALRTRELTASAVTERCLHAIAEQDRSLNAFITVLADEAREQARQADAEIAAGRHRGPLHGVPISLKDLIDLEGTPTTAASRVREARKRSRGRHVRGAAARGRRDLHRQDQPPRVRAWHHQRGLGLRTRQASARSNPIARWVVWRLGGVGTSRTWPTRLSEPTPAGRFEFHRRPAASWG